LTPCSSTSCFQDIIVIIVTEIRPIAPHSRSLEGHKDVQKLNCVNAITRSKNGPSEVDVKMWPGTEVIARSDLNGNDDELIALMNFYFVGLVATQISVTCD
jgi:hypothetical protein